MINRITQSFMNDMRDYLNGNLCGNILREKWVNDKLIDLGSDSVELGCYFEYILTEELLGAGKGTLPKDGHVPQCGMYTNGKQRLAPYELAHKNKDRVVAYLKKMNLKVVAAGKKLVAGKYEGTIDLICEVVADVTFHDGSTWKKGDKIIIDIKYSGLITDKWSKFGWEGMLGEGPHIQKEYHGTQAIQYHFIGKLPFYFLVVSSKNEEDIVFLRVPVDQVMIDKHVSEGNWLLERFFFLEKAGAIVPKPEVSTCAACQIREACKDKHEFPHPKNVTLV